MTDPMSVNVTFESVISTNDEISKQKSEDSFRTISRFAAAIMESTLRLGVVSRYLTITIVYLNIDHVSFFRCVNDRCYANIIVNTMSSTEIGFYKHYQIRI